MIRRTMFRIIVMADRGRGMKLDSTMPRPEMLLTEVWLGDRKKKTAAAMIATAAVRTAVSLMIAVEFNFFWFIVVSPNLDLSVLR